MPTVAIDATDAFVPAPRGWGLYAHRLVAALGGGDEGLRVRALRAGGSGPEVLWEQLALPRLLRREEADVVHAPNCFLPLRRPCPGVVTVHDLAFEAHPGDFSRRTGAKYRFFAPRAARSAERVICVSAFTRDDVAARYGIDSDKMRVVPNAPVLAEGSVQPPPGPYLLAVGDLRAKKNLGRLVTAWRRLRAEGLEHRLVLAGHDAGEGPRLRAAAGAEPLELTGYLSAERLDALMRGAALLVHPSLYEGFGLPLVEAMARGVPVAAARATALPEVAGDAAVYFDPGDVEEMARVIGDALQDDQLRSRLVERGRARAARLSWARTARETAAVYRELV